MSGPRSVYKNGRVKDAITATAPYYAVLIEIIAAEMNIFTTGQNMLSLDPSELRQMSCSNQVYGKKL